MAKVIVAIILTLVTFAWTQSTTDSITSIASDVDIMTIMNTCNESFRIDMAYLEALNETGSFIDETDRTPKCFIRCVLQNVGILSEDGRTFNPALAAMIFAGERNGKPVDDIGEITTLCADRPEKCMCEKSYKFMKCLISTEIERYEKPN